jgi:DNA-binding XRE family transcriptional regulator
MDSFGIEAGELPALAIDGSQHLIPLAIVIVQQIPERMKDERARREISYRQAAQEIGIAPSAFYYIETRRRDPGLVISLRILRWLAGLHD